MCVVRVRYAPSPTGTLHIGGARTALFNFLFARHHGGRLILRVEDTDQSRQVPDSEAQMMRGLQSLGIEWDEGPDRGGDFGPYRQSERLARHQELANRLLSEDKAYRCYCTPEELEAERKARQKEGLPPRYSGRCRFLTPDEIRQREGQPYVVRLKVPDTGETVVEDLIRGTVRFDNRVLDDFIIMKRDYTPVYNFAVVADDHDMAMTHVIRGEEHLSNTPKQLLVYQALGFQPPQFAHLPMILAPDRSKLSKRHGATSVEEYRDQGILPEALANYLLLLGWSDPNGREFLTLEEAARLFTLDRVQHTAAIYDQKKLEWMNHQYLMQLPLERVVEAVRPFITYALDNGPPLSDAVALSRERSATLVQLAESMRFLYEAPRTFEAKAVAKQFTAGVDELLEAIRDRLLTVTPWDHDHLMNAYDQLAEARQVKRAVLIHPTRLAVTGRSVGPGLFELLTLLGRDETVKRLQFAADALRTGTLATD